MTEGEDTNFWFEEKWVRGKAAMVWMGSIRWIVDASREGAKLARNEIKMQFRAKPQSRKEVAKKKYNRGSVTRTRKARKENSKGSNSCCAV